MEVSNPLRCNLLLTASLSPTILQCSRRTEERPRFGDLWQLTLVLELMTVFVLFAKEVASFYDCLFIRVGRQLA